jgi:hypothetical protein
MDRGPVALFGAIVAVGLGPAMWLGAHLGRFDVAPSGPSVPVDRTHVDTARLVGGTGTAPDEQDTDQPSIGATRRAYATPSRAAPVVIPTRVVADAASVAASASPEAVTPTGPAASPSGPIVPSTESTTPVPPSASAGTEPSEDTGGSGGGTGNDATPAVSEPVEQAAE